ncbi:4Fe-4S dicluster domain-containing protein [Pseudobutyrivibrio ruminis]|uniref:Adenylylsulfate reductase subunit B n=1 Tax=Pseudobutyrivibrio ruminis DSM 9787 TaxID=1123011 RepID=A0A285SIP4_9FIRM|nr:ferredoxin family protein [Pseudobutyrivibrio ruminis]SOC05980.1 adenylylsulfate reductase subunit B [Pseudobutyrivibrio ruminis DSM 9787]
MSIRINSISCVGCKRCVEACPGNLIKIVDNKAVIKREKDCWGCTSCLKECKVGAIDFFLGADIGGKGSTLSVTEKGDIREWIVIGPDGNKKTITVNTKESNKY